MNRFKRYLFGATALSNVPLLVGVALLFGGSWAAWVGATLVALILTRGLRGRLRLAFDDHPISPLRRWLVEKPYFLHWAAALGSLPVAIMTAPLLFMDEVPVGAWALGSYLAPFALAVYAIFVRPHLVRVREVEIPMAGLDAAFDGYRIVQLSDTHVGSLTPPERARAWVQKANALAPDLVALTGDYVTSGTRFHEAAARVFGELQARDGTVAVLGNHDNFGGCEPLVTTMREVGITLLMNQHTVIERGGAALVVVGVDDVFTRRANVEETFRGIPRGAPIVGLAHDPRLFPAMAERGAKLVLSGHTHWGQVALPFFARAVNVARPFFRFPGGLYEAEGGARLWVHPGLGTTGPPVRLGAAPELTVLVLRHSARG